jgi:hypothetical protein
MVATSMVGCADERREQSRHQFGDPERTHHDR